MTFHNAAGMYRKPGQRSLHAWRSGAARSGAERRGAARMGRVGERVVRACIDSRFLRERIECREPEERGGARKVLIY